MKRAFIALFTAALAGCNWPQIPHAESGDRIRVHSPVFIQITDDAMEHGV